MNKEIQELINKIVLEKDIKKNNFLRLKLQIAIEKFNTQKLVDSMKYIFDANKI